MHTPSLLPFSSTRPPTSMLRGLSISPSSRDDPRLERAGSQMQYSEKERRHQQLKSCVQRLRAARIPGSDPGGVDGAFEEFVRVREEAGDIVRALVTSQRPGGGHGRFQSRGACRRNGSVQETIDRLEMLRIASGNSPGDNDVDGLMAAFGNMGIANATGPARPRSKSQGGRLDPAWLTTIQDWKAAIQRLLDSHRASLAEMYRAYEKDTTPEMVERIFNDLKSRAETIHNMKTGRSSLMSSQFGRTLAYLPTLERRFQNYDTLKEAVLELDKYLRLGEAGVDDGDRLVKDYVIVERGDAILEFANLDSHDSPVLRFRVSSHMLAETSPIFRAVFQGQFSHPRVLDRGLRELEGQVPREPPPFVTCPDGAEVKLYSMPQLELNKDGSLGVLLYAAHMQNDKVPREVSFAQFTAIAEVCLRYQCTSPLEVVVEHRWLPKWVHMANEDQPDGLLLISYAFGLRRIFTRMSKNAVLNIVDEEELRGKNWPEKIKEKVWAVRSAKLAQVHAACSGAIQEYFRPPTGKGKESDGQGSSPQFDSPISPSSFSKASTFLPTLLSDKPPPPSYSSLFSLTSTPRCPKGSHWCDATNLGWLLLVLNELQLLWTVITPAATPREQATTSTRPPPPRSLAQLLDALRSIPSPPQPVHPGGPGVCDPAPVFRAAVNDVYNSISGLTLFDVDGKRHGWALSKQHASGPQSAPKVPLGSFGRTGPRDEKVAPAHMANYVDGGPETTVGSRGARSEDPEQVGVDDDDDDDDGIWAYRPPVAFAPDEPVCLRILGSADSFDDLHALALASRAFYAAFKRNELALMRRVVRTNRRLTLRVLSAGGGGGGGPLPSGTGRGGGDDKVLVPAAGDMTTPTTGGEDAGRGDVLGLHGGLGPRGWGLEGPGDSRSMTEEEAHRILWPDQAPGQRHNDSTMGGGVAAKGKQKPPTLLTPMPRDDSGEKFLAGEITIVQEAEEKALVILGDKNLRGESDGRRGITSE